MLVVLVRYCDLPFPRYSAELTKSIDAAHKPDAMIMQTQDAMNFDNLIARLRALEAPDPAMNKVLAQVLTWKRTYAKLQDDATGEERVRWLAPKKAPGDGEYLDYTGSLQHAYIFARQIAPNEGGGFSWELGTASAIIGQSNPAQAPTPAVALIIASLQNLSYRLADVRNIRSTNQTA